jgi:hypothetical protein
MKRIVLLLALLALPAAAHAAGVEDRDDSDSKVDIQRATGSHNRAKDELVHVITTYEAFSSRTLLNRDGPPGSVCVSIWTTRTPGEAPANYEACATSDRTGRKWQGSLARNPDRGTPIRRGSVKVEHPSSRRLVIRIDPDRMRRPASYSWTVEAVTWGTGCPSVTGCEDFAPDRPDTLETKLGRAG